MLCIVSYDIPDDRRRTRLHKKMKDFGVRVQYSVFECVINKKIIYERMMSTIAEVIDPVEDSVRVYPVCAACLKMIRVFGKGEVTHDEPVYII